MFVNLLSTIYFNFLALYNRKKYILIYANKIGKKYIE